MGCRGRAPQEIQPQEIEPGYVCPPPGQSCNALTTVERLLDATLRVLRDGQGLLLGNVLEGFVAHADMDVFLNFGQVLLVGPLNWNNKLDPLLLGARIAGRCTIFKWASSWVKRLRFGLLWWWAKADILKYKRILGADNILLGLP